MGKSYLIGILPISLFLSSCGTGTIHPLPEDVTPLNTHAIVTQIRCEARYAMKKAVVNFILNPKLKDVISENSRLLARRLESNSLRFYDLDLNSLDNYARGYIQKYEEAAIAYGFTFTMKNKNGASPTISLFSGITNGSFTPGLSAGLMLERQTVRAFDVADTFGSLRTFQGCATDTPAAKNHLYPITGEIGITEMVRTFINLNEQNNLGKAETVPTLSDTFEFDTIVSATITPKVNLAPATRALHITDASMPLDTTRSDKHTVIVVLSLDPKKAGPDPVLPAPSVLGVKPRPRRTSRSNAENAAIEEVQRQRTLNTLTNIGNRLR